ncbi:MAG TPA: alpha-isopropylmalate synthase regulatory domain-containing protein [Candidatus Limnocylindrales bacterium]|nr:alpha-isopropylmalate synthase regulatory domain-containing protein [Candidatus Limnocylindrales bacterium]
MTDAPRPVPSATAPAATAEQVSLERWTVTSGSNANSRAAVVLHAGEHDWKASAEGTGAVDALFKAIDQALAPILGGHPRLVAYDVHALDEGPAAEGRVTVQISPPRAAEGDRADGRFSAEVASTNTIAASVEAYVDALNAMLGEQPWAGAADEAAAGRRRARTGDAAGVATTEYDTEAGHIDTTEWFNR